MADDLKSIGVKERVSAAEWKVRCDLAALYRLVARWGWDDLIFTHISARVPGPEHHFLINPYGQFFGEITASSLVKVDLEGNVVEPTDYFINPAGFTIHSAIHAAREDAKFVLHLHTDNGIAVSATKEGLLPLSQTALTVLPRLAYHEYEGIALDLGERERLVKDLGDKSLMMLWNHGTLAVGETAGQCWLGIYYAGARLPDSDAGLESGSRASAHRPCRRPGNGAPAGDGRDGNGRRFVLAGMPAQAGSRISRVR